MKTVGLLLLLSFLFLSSCENEVDLNKWKPGSESEFFKSQLQFPRVREAFQQKENTLKSLLLQQQIESFEIDLFLRAFKEEKQFELWAKPRTQTNYQLIKTYDFCRSSGTFGPKRREGDYQIPEGFYRISHYNPKSNFLLSLKVNYPNASDKILSDPSKPGDDIYIHGGCQTVGCIPIKDSNIQEVYLLAVLAKKDGASIPIHIFPFRMSDKNMEQYTQEFAPLETFWKSLQKGYQFFERKRQLPSINVTTTGAYEMIE